jgi:hypothetical protein
MKIKVEFPQIRAASVTHPKFDADEIYLAYFVTLAKKGEKDTPSKGQKRKYVVKAVSDVKEKVKKGKTWTPKSLSNIVEIGDAETMFLTFALYEADDKKIYKKLVNEADVLINPEDFDWSEMEVPSDIMNWLSWLKAAWKLVVSSYNYFKQDDHFGTKTIEIHDFQKKGWRGFREVRFDGMGGRYYVTLNLTMQE